MVNCRQLWGIVWAEKRFLIILFIFSFLVRAFVFFFHVSEGEHCLLAFDTQQYQSVALNIMQGNGISTVPGVPDFYRLPGYPIFLALCYKLFGVNNQAVLWFQLLLASFIPLLVFGLSHVLFPGYMMLARFVGLGAALHIGFVLYSGIMGSESLFLLFFLLFLILLFLNISLWFTGSAQRYSPLFFLAGFFLGCASLIRAVGHYVIILALFLIALSSLSLSEKIKSGLLLFLG
jgi:4-amino-4-deoxy-L-arabinose transferase-like glycosyltransferase